MLSSGQNQIAYAHFTNGAPWLLNAGRSFPSDQGERLIAPFLRRRGIQRPEGILLTDLSKKHTRGLVSVMRDFPGHYLLYPAVLPYGPDGFYQSFLKLGCKAKSFQQGDEVSMGMEKMRMIAQSEKGAAFLVESDSWRILFISRWDPGLFRELLQGHGNPDEVHAVFLPASGQWISKEFQEWLDRVQPALTVFSDPQSELAACLAYRHIPYLDLKDTGALDFKRNGPRLELTPFVKGYLGVYAYS